MVHLGLWMGELTIVYKDIDERVTDAVPAVHGRTAVIETVGTVDMCSGTTAKVHYRQTGSQSGTVTIVNLEGGMGGEVDTALGVTDDMVSLQLVIEVLPGEGSSESNIGPKTGGLGVVPATVPGIRGATVTRSSHVSLHLLDRSAPGTSDARGVTTLGVKRVPTCGPVPVPPGRTYMVPPLVGADQQIAVCIPVVPRTVLTGELPDETY